MSHIPSLTTTHRITVPEDAELLVFTDPYRPNIQLTKSTSCVEISVPEKSAVTYSFQSGDLKYADPKNAEGAGPQASLLIDRSIDRRLWPSRPSDEIANIPGERLVLDRQILGRRCTARIDRRNADVTVVFLDGDDWIYLHDLTNALDQAVTNALLPQMNRVFLPASSERSQEFTSPEFAWTLAHTLPKVLKSSRLILVGQSFGGLAAIVAGIASSTAGLSSIQGIVAQSPAVWWRNNDSEKIVEDSMNGPSGGLVATQLSNAKSTISLAGNNLTSPQFILTSGYEEAPMHRHVDAVAKALGDLGFPTSNHRTPGGHDPAMWRYGIIPALNELLC